MTYITATERVYRELSAPKPPCVKPIAENRPLTLRLTEAYAILQSKRQGTPEELQHIIDHKNEFHLREDQVDKAKLLLTIAAAAKSRAAHGIHEDKTSAFFAMLGIQETERGLLYEPQVFTDELRAGARAIAECKRHRVPKCKCWRESRERLWAIRQAYGDDSPEGSTALKVWEILEWIEECQRTEPTVLAIE